MVKFAVVKNHESGKLGIRNATDLYILNSDCTRCKKWVPTDDFNKKDIFGIPHKQNMVVHSLLAVHENPAKLQEMIDKREIRNPKRLSVDQKRIPMSKLKLLDRISGAAQKSTKRQAKKDKKHASHLNAHKVYESMTNDEDNDGDKDDSNQDEKTDEDESDDDDNEDNSKADENTIQSHGESDSSNKQQEDLTNENKCTGNCDMVSFLKNELSLAHERIKTLESERSQVLLKVDKNLSSIAALKGGSTSCSAADYKGVPSEDGTFAEDGKIHFGSNLILKSSDVTKIEMSSFDLRKRVKGLLELLFPNDILQRALKPDKVKDSSVSLTISQGIVCVITEVLKRMAWESDAMKGFTSKQCAIVITKVLTQLRSDAAFSKLSPEEQQRIRDERKRKAQESRKKNTKKSKDADSSEDSN